MRPTVRLSVYLNATWVRNESLLACLRLRVNKEEKEGDWYHLFMYRRLTKARLEGILATPTMEVPFGPFHDERIVYSSCPSKSPSQTPCTRSEARLQL